MQDHTFNLSLVRTIARGEQATADGKKWYWIRLYFTDSGSMSGDYVELKFHGKPKQAKVDMEKCFQELLDIAAGRNVKEGKSDKPNERVKGPGTKIFKEV